MVTLEDYMTDGFLGDANLGQQELQKAIQAGQITGRDTTGQLLTGEPLKVESLDTTLKLLEFRTQDIKLWGAIPKATAFNTVEEYIQLISYGSNRGGFYDEGELSNVEDSKYKRQAEHVKYIQVTGEVTVQSQMVKSYVDTYRKEVENKIMWVSRKVNEALTKADSQIISQEFNSLYSQHSKNGPGVEALYATFEDYYNSGVVIDLRGSSLKQQNVEEGAVAVDANYGYASTLFAPTTVISALSQDYFEKQRIMFNPGQGFSGNIGTPIKGIDTTLGNIALMSDKFMKQDPPRKAIDAATSQQAPAAPVWDGVAPAAVAANVISKYQSNEVGDVYFAVSAVNRYGESQLSVYGTAVTLAAGSHVDLKFTAGNGAMAATGYVIYRTKVTTAGAATGLTFYPIFKISEAGRANGYNGGGAGIVRDLGYFLPDTEQAFVTDMSDEVLAFSQLAPISKLDLAVQSMSKRFITFLFGTPILMAPKKLVRYINVGKTLTA